MKILSFSSKDFLNEVKNLLIGSSIEDAENDLFKFWNAELNASEIPWDEFSAKCSPKGYFHHDSVLCDCLEHSVLLLTFLASMHLYQV